jgi:O-antigen/teichoic acid export membrane protein
MGDDRPALRQLVVRGGMYMIVRQAFGLIVGLAGVLLLTRLIGPRDYGLYAAALAIVSFVSGVGRFGVEVYLVRREEPPDVRVYGQAFTLLLASGMGLTALCLVASPLLLYWYDEEQFLPPLRALLLGLPLTLLCLPAFAALERGINFRKVAILELVGQLIFYIVALPLALLDLGVWAPVTGFWVWQAWLVGGGYAFASLRPRLTWSPALLRDMLGYGIGFSVSAWIWGLRSLVNPLVVGRYLGPESVGYVSLAIRLAEVLSFVRDATWRVSITALARVQGTHARLRRVMEEAMTLQVLGLAPVLALGAAGLWAVPTLLGSRWQPILGIFPYIALGSLINAVFNMHSAALYVLRRNGAVALFHAAHIVLFAGGAMVLVPSVGLIGYGLAELVAVAGYVVVHWQITKLFPVSYRGTLPWLLGLAPAIFAMLLPLPWTLLPVLPVVVLLCRRDTRRFLARYARELRPVGG